eukprot:365019-Chlamydomonas_euryale.AAC.12
MHGCHVGKHGCHQSPGTYVPHATCNVDITSSVHTGRFVAAEQLFQFRPVEVNDVLLSQRSTSSKSRENCLAAGHMEKERLR